MIQAWQEQDYQYFLSAISQQRLPHAILFSGLTGISKLNFCRHLAARLHCHSPHNNQRCGRCHSCQLMDAGTHPDLKFIEPEGKAGEIKIDQIRKLDDFVGQTAALGHKRIIIIKQAEAMNINAANALLKMLEEPGKDCHFFLCSSQRQKLLPTIQSRCQVYALQMPTQQQVKTYLKEQAVKGDRLEFLLAAFPCQPLYVEDLLLYRDIEPIVDLQSQLIQVLKQQRSISEIKCDKAVFEQSDLLFDMLQSQFHEALTLVMRGKQEDTSGKPLQAFLQSYHAASIIDCQQVLQQFRQSASLTNLNLQMMFESLFFALRKSLR